MYWEQGIRCSATTSTGRFEGVLLLRWSEDKTNMFQIPVTSVPGKQVSPRVLSAGEAVDQQINSQCPPSAYCPWTNYDTVGKIWIPLNFFKSVNSFKTCWWSELTKKRSQSEQVFQKYNQADGRRRKKKLKKWTFQIPSAQIVPFVKCNFSCSMLCCPMCRTSAFHPLRQNIKI